MKFENLEDLVLHYDQLPVVVALDVMKRVADWIEVEGNTSEDDYVKRQIEYANKFLN